MALQTYHVFNAATGLNFYSVVIRQSNGYKYNQVSEEFEEDPTAIQAGYAIPEVGSTTYKIQVPDDIAGNFNIVVFQRVGGANDFSADTLIATYPGSLGSIFGF